MAPMLQKAPQIADVAAARRRSDLYGLDPTTAEIPYLGEPRPAGVTLRRLSGPVLDQLVLQLAGTPLAIVLADREGRVTRRDAPATRTLAALESRSIDIGFSLAESDVGTNGVGTSLETRRPAVVRGEDHFLECFHAFTCANAPIFDPITRRIEGTVGLLCPASETAPLLLSTALHLSAQVSELLLEHSSPEEQFLLSQFLRSRRTSKTALAAMSGGVLIATPAAQRLLTNVDHGELWDFVNPATSSPGAQVRQLDFPRPSGPPLRLRCQPLFRGGDIAGVTVEFVAERTATTQSGRRSSDHRLADLVGTSDAWRAMVDDARRTAGLGEPILVVGERGSGRLSVASAIAELGGLEPVSISDSATLVAEGPRVWLRRTIDALSTDTTVLLRRVDQLPNDVAAAMATALSSGNTTAQVLATTERTAASEPGLAALLDQLLVLRIDVPPLRERGGDMGALVEHLLRDIGRGQAHPSATSRVISVLSRHRWPGNVTELRQALRSAHAKAAGAPIAVEHLPRHLRQPSNRKPLHGLQRQEADAIMAAISATTTRTEAAQLLGISRATLYRRIDSYGLDADLT